MKRRMTYRGSLLTRIAGTVLIAFVWFGFLFVYLSFFSGPDINLELAVLLITGMADGGVIATVWLIWFLRDRKAFQAPPPQGLT